MGVAPKGFKTKVFRACDDLFASGRKVTVAQVVQRVGGNIYTVSPLVRAWKMHREGLHVLPQPEPAHVPVIDGRSETVETRIEQELIPLLQQVIFLLEEQLWQQYSGPLPMHAYLERLYGHPDKAMHG